MGDNKARAQLYVSHEDLELIDQAAKMSGESRSRYMVRCCLENMGRVSEFSNAQQDEIRAIVLDSLGEVARIDWVLQKGKGDAG